MNNEFCAEPSPEFATTILHVHACNTDGTVEDLKKFWQNYTVKWAKQNVSIYPQTHSQYACFSLFGRPRSVRRFPAQLRNFDKLAAAQYK